MIRDDHVFINCPFDNEYFPILKAILFSIIYTELIPKISETSDSGDTRIDAIVGLMAVSKFSIHDLSRVQIAHKKAYPRFNMPFEYGIDFGLKRGNPDLYAPKRFLILEKEPYRYKQIISDISGSDIKYHNNEPELAIKAVRDWFRVIQPKVPKHKEIWLAYNEFSADYERILKEDGYNPADINALTFTDIIENMREWIKDYKQKPGS